MRKEQDRLIKVDEVAAMTGLSPKTVYAMEAGTDRLLRIHLGRLIRFSYLDVVQWIERKKTAAIERQERKNISLLARPKKIFSKKDIDRICESNRKMG